MFNVKVKRKFVNVECDRYWQRAILISGLIATVQFNATETVKLSIVDSA